MKSKASIKNIKLPDAPEPTRAVYKKPVVGNFAPGMRVVELPCLYNPRPAPIPKRKPKPAPKPKQTKEEAKIEEAVKASKARWWNEERIKTIIKLHREGVTYSNIAAQMGTTKGAVSAQVMRLIDRGLLEPREERDTWSQEDLDKLMELRAEGKTYGEIGDLLGRNPKVCGEAWRRQNAKQNDMRNLFH